uniref:Exocyst complex component 6 (inferred by orthology to a C. elegans protein) n=1 Tax=Nippostrongylus brasiliensis TaxID=27835 RepID=A0A0N4YC48_NIPBR
LQDDEKVSAQDLIDFTPVHRCCQIFNVLGAKEEFDVYYRQQRKDQCDLVIEPPPKMNSLKHYVDYLDEIIGFFVVEDHIIITEPTLVTSSHKDQLWESALKKIIHTMNSRFGGCPDVEMMLRMKKVILLFALTMKSYGYGIAPLYSLLQNFRDQYNEILMTEYCAQFERDLEKDNYAPISVENDEQFRAIIKDFPFYKRSMEQEPFPRKFPYSRFVVSAYLKAKMYLQGCLKFMEHLQLTQSEMDDTVRRYANVLLSRWSGSLKCFVEKKLSLVQLVQITVNIGYLEKSCESLGVYITKLTSGNDLSVSMTAHQLSLTERVFRDARSELVQITVNIGYLEKSCESLGVYITKLTSGNDLSVSMTAHQLSLTERVFRDARSEVEQQIEVCIRDKVDAFVELARYDWELPSSSVNIGYLEKSCESLGVYITKLTSGNDLSVSMTAHQLSLTERVFRDARSETCKHLSSRLSDLLLSPDVRAISMGALEQFSLDVMQCEMFTARCPVAGFDHNTLPMTFAHLRQLLELVMSNDWTSYLAEYGQETGTYVRVNAATATQLLEKYFLNNFRNRLYSLQYI